MLSFPSLVTTVVNQSQSQSPRTELFCFLQQPLVRQDLPQIVKALSSLDGVRNVGVTTNGINLRRKIPALREAGLTHINVSASLPLSAEPLVNL